MEKKRKAPTPKRALKPKLKYRAKGKSKPSKPRGSKKKKQRNSFQSYKPINPPKPSTDETSTKGYMSPEDLASWVKKIFKSVKKDVDTSNILKLQVNGFTMTWASTSQIAEMMGNGMTVKAADFLRRKLAEHQGNAFADARKSKEYHPSLLGIQVGDDSLPAGKEKDPLPAPSRDAVNNLRFISDKDEGEYIFEMLLEQEENPKYAAFTDQVLSFDLIWMRTVRLAKARMAESEADMEEPSDKPVMVCIGDIFKVAGGLMEETAMYSTWIHDFLSAQVIPKPLKSNSYKTRLIIEATKDNTVPLTKDGLREACIAKMHEAQSKVCDEVFTTERDFVAGLQRTVEVYAPALRPLLKPEDYQMIFGTFEILNGIHSFFFEKIRENRGDVLGAFLLLMPHFKTHTEYTANYRKVQALVVQLMKQSEKLSDAVAKCDAVKSNSGNLDQRFDSLLQQPITRITRYELLLKDLAKWMTPELIELTMPLKENLDVRTTMKLTQEIREGVELPEDDEDSAFEELPVEDTEIVVKTLIGDESTGSKGLAAECNFKQDDVIVSINGVKVSGALDDNETFNQFKKVADKNETATVMVERNRVAAALKGVHAVALRVNRGIADMSVKTTFNNFLSALPEKPGREKQVEWIFKDPSVEVSLTNNLPEDMDMEEIDKVLMADENTAFGFMSARERKLTKVDMLVILEDSLLIANSRVPEHGIILPLPLTNITCEGLPEHEPPPEPAPKDVSPAPMLSRLRRASSLIKNRTKATLTFSYTASKCQKYYNTHFGGKSLVAEMSHTKITPPSRFNDSVYTWPHSASKHGSSSARWTCKKANRGEVQYPVQVQHLLEAALCKGEATCKIYDRVTVNFAESREEDTSSGKKNSVHHDVFRNGKKITPSVITTVGANYEKMAYHMDSLDVTVKLSAESTELRELYEQLTAKPASPVICDGMPYLNLYDCMLRVPASNELLQSVWLEKANSKQAAVREKFFEDILSIYEFKFLHGKGKTPSSMQPHEAFVREMFCNPDKFKILREQTFVMTSKQYDRELVQTSLAMRFPVYFGIPALVDYGLRTSYYHKNRVPEVLGYDLLTREVPGEMESVRYVIAGRVDVNPGFNKHKLKNICVVHVWGCNFENRTTWDFKHIHKSSEDDETFRTRYREKTLEMFRMICEAAEKLECTTIRMPAIGAGQYTNALPDKRKRYVDIDFLTCLEQAQLEYPKLEISRRFPFNPSDPTTNLFQKISKDNTCLVNTWDSRSFIGNGGSEDKTIDGWMVTGICNGKSTGNNTSFLQNVFFMPELMSPENWTFIKHEGTESEFIQREQSEAVSAAFASGAAFVWDDDGVHSFKIFNSTQEAEMMFHEQAKSYQCAAVFGFSIAKERHNIILQHKRNRTVFEKMKGKQKLMEILTDYFDVEVVPAFAKLQRLSRKHLLKKAAQQPISPGRPVSMAHGVAPPLPANEPGKQRPKSMMPSTSRPPLPSKKNSKSSKSKSIKYSKSGAVRLTRGKM